MHRRTYLAAVCTTGTVAIAGCGTLADEQTLSEPTVNADSSGRKALIFSSDDEEVGHFGVDGSVDSNYINLSTEIWHQEGTNVKSVALRVWMTTPQVTDAAADVAVISPVEGDSSPPPSITLHSPPPGPGTVIELDDFDDLKDETISTLGLIVKPGSHTATTLVIHATIELTGNGVLSDDYTLDGELQLEYPELNT